MKIRLGFVSNSSSSHFITIKELPKNFKFGIGNQYQHVSFPIKEGDSEFGWSGFNNDLASKLNYMWLTFCYFKNYIDSEWKAGRDPAKNDYCSEASEILNNKEVKRVEKLIKDTLKKYLKSKTVNLNYANWKKEDLGSIDHQSAPPEDFDSFKKIFKDEISLSSFLLNRKSEIESGDDNDDD